MSGEMKAILGLIGVLVVTGVLTGLTIWSFGRPKNGDGDNGDNGKYGV
mgnify:FL=1